MPRHLHRCFLLAMKGEFQMAVNEQIVTGRKFRKLIDESNKLWQRISFWTKSSDVEFDDGKDAETKIGAIDGITDSLVSTSSRIAASAKAVNTLSNNLPQFIYDEEGKITGYKTKDGADTVFPFSGGSGYIESITIFGFGNRNTDNPYDIKTFRQVYDPNKIGDQKLLSASGYYQSGWHLSVSVSSKASGYSGANGVGGIHTTELSTIAWL